MSKLTELKKLAGARNRATIDAAFARLGPRCSITAVEAATGLCRSVVARRLREIRGGRRVRPESLRGDAWLAAAKAKREAVAEANARLGFDATTAEIAKAAGLDWSAAHYHLKKIRDPDRTGRATFDEIVARLESARAARRIAETRAMAPKPARRQPTLAEAAARDYREARRSTSKLAWPIDGGWLAAKAPAGR